MRLKGLVWFFTIALILISLWELSYTIVVRSYESKVKGQAERMVRNQNPNLPAAQKDALVEAKTKYILDSTKEKEIYPVIGTTYQKAKENELNLGLDLQGGISVTMDVSLEGLLKSLSNNSSDSSLLKAIRTANSQKALSESDFITLFTTAFKEQNGSGKLSSLFAGPNKDIKVGDSDQQVEAKLRVTAQGAIKQTYQILVKRIDKFGVAQPNINLDENKGVINVELAGITDPERVRKFLQSSANLQFWSVVLLKDQAFQKSFFDADKALARYLKGTNDTSAKKADSLATGILPTVIQFPVDPKNGQIYETPFLGTVAQKDTGLLNSYFNNPVFLSALPNNVKLAYGVLQKATNGQGYFEIYALEKIPGSEKAAMEGESISEAMQAFDQKGKPSIKMQMTSQGSRTWANLTGKNAGRYVAISLDNTVYSAPRVANKIEGGDTEISGSFTVEEAQDLANILKSGKLDAPAKIVAEQIVGPTLGKEAVKGGAIAFGVAFLVIFILMLVYYNTGGWVANIALILNLLFTIGVLAALGFTLTAAGIAGLVLTIGMAVDTNVIIFERIKDELNKGKSYQQSVKDGYSHSLPPVLDAHVTSLLTAIILAYFGLGPVLGFATTQIIGILLSLFCGILVSRLITDFWTKKNRHFKYFTATSKRVFRNANYNFVKFRKYAYMISGVVLLLGIASFFNGFHEGVEFKGGRSYTVEFNNSIKVDQVRDDLRASLDGDNVTLKTVGDDRHINITTAYLKGVENADSAVQTRIYQGLKNVLPAAVTYTSFVNDHIQSSTTVQPSISDDLKRGAVKATIFAILAIFIYIFVRFKDWRYSLGTIFTLLHDVLVTLIVFSFFKNIVPFPLEIDQHFIAAILTVIGFSMNDTVVVFDRVREYARDMKGSSKSTIINKAINDTLSRTIMTSLTVFLTLLALFIFGGEVTRGFAFAMLIGVVTGSYSSIFVGAPVLLDFAKNKPLGSADTIIEAPVKTSGRTIKA